MRPFGTETCCKPGCTEPAHGLFYECKPHLDAVMREFHRKAPRLREPLIDTWPQDPGELYTEARSVGLLPHENEGE